MSVHLECERCGQQEQTGDVMVLARFVGPGLPTVRPELPGGWTRPQLPTEDGELRYKDLCPGCKADLFRFMEGAAVAVPRAPAAEDVAVCSTCGPTPLEPHPRLPVQRCSNCKEHLAASSGPEQGGQTDG